MKYLFLISAVFMFGFTVMKDSPNDFDQKLSNIVSEFKRGIMNEAECVKLKEESFYLSLEISDAIKKDYNYTPNEISVLRKLYKEVDAIEEYIGAVGNCDVDLPINIEKFNLANQRVGGGIVSISKDEFCVDVISITIGNYKAYLLENRLSQDHKVNYKWKTPNGLNSGSGTTGLLKSSFRHIYNNRKKPSQNNLIVFGITCTQY